MQNVFILSKISSLTSIQCPCSFDKSFNLVVNPAESIILYYMNKTIPNMQDIQQQQMFSYIFT